ncbi:hypothetical protein HY970_01665 [Candidatus Kaiserbacteria bacterium]|nr:hypothetical protein [Candidatus Kaiserbacteria bacterium]
MSWASRRRASYAFGVSLFFAVVIGGPIGYWYFSIPATCTDGIENQGETDVDRGGPCLLLDTRALSPASILWSRSFRVRDGSYSAAAYIQNANEQAGVSGVRYKFTFYDEKNIFVGERFGSTYIMPGSITPIFEGAIATGNRVVAHTYFQFEDPLAWERLENRALSIEINDKQLTDIGTVPRVHASARNTSVHDMYDVVFRAAVFDPAGNAFAASETTIPKLRAGEKQNIVFTWPDPFTIAVGRIDVVPLVKPAMPRAE